MKTRRLGICEEKKRKKRQGGEIECRRRHMKVEIVGIAKRMLGKEKKNGALNEVDSVAPAGPASVDGNALPLPRQDRLRAPLGYCHELVRCGNTAKTVKSAPAR